MIENTNDTLTISVAKVKEIVVEITDEIIKDAQKFFKANKKRTKDYLIEGLIEIIEDTWTDKHDDYIEAEAIKENVFV